MRFRFWDCFVSGCPNAAAIENGACELCESMYCSEHIAAPSHTCSRESFDDKKWEAALLRELEALGSKTSDGALLRRAKKLQEGFNCRLNDKDPLRRHKMGGMYVHLELRFDDGTVWLARLLRETVTPFDDDFSNQILLSECATLRWLEYIDIPTPKLHDYGLRGDADNEVGVAYVLIDKLPGRPFNSGVSTEKEKTTVLRQWAEILCTLRKHPFSSIGSLAFDSGDTIKVIAIASDQTGTLPRLGPCTTAKEFYRTWANAYLDLIADRQLYPAFSIDAYLMFKSLLESAVSGPWLDEWRSLDSGPFFLKHTDDKGDHKLVDEKFRIAGIIDWTFARTAPAYEAMGPSLVSANSANTNDMFSETPGLSTEDLVVRKAIASSGTRLGMGLGVNAGEATELFQAILTTAGDPIADINKWREKSLSKWADEPRLSMVCQMLLASQPSPSNGLTLSSTRDTERFATCSHESCKRPSVRGRSCPICQSHLCALHGRSPHHGCPSSNSLDDETWEANLHSEVKALLDLVHISALTRKASSLRNGVPCIFEPGQYIGGGAMMGCANHHSWILFDDGVRWLARMPRVTEISDIPASPIEYLVESEFATLKFLEKLNVSTPRVHGFGVASDPNNDVGTSFILEDAMPGKPFKPHQATAEQKAHVHSQYAEILIEISRHPLQQACSLVPRANEFVPGAIASDRKISLGQHGPYASPLTYFNSIATSKLDLIADGQLHTKFLKEAFLLYHLLGSRVAPALTSDMEEFFLKHVDDKGDHILIDEEFNITAVIDWQFARFVPACEAFGPSLFTAKLNDLYGDAEGLSDDDLLLADMLRTKGREDLAAIAKGGELARRFHFGLPSGLREKEILPLVQAVLSLVRGSKISDGETKKWMEREWKRLPKDARCQKVKQLLGEIEAEGCDT